MPNWQCSNVKFEISNSILCKTSNRIIWNPHRHALSFVLEQIGRISLENSGLICLICSSETRKFFEFARGFRLAEPPFFSHAIFFEWEIRTFLKESTKSWEIFAKRTNWSYQKYCGILCVLLSIWCRL